MGALERCRMGLVEAATEKWVEGRGPDDFADWRGCHPLVEAHEEVLDLYNYTHNQRARRIVPEGWCTERRLGRIRRLIGQLDDELALAMREAGLL